ncbi:uncharacterized protein LOC115884296 [Sitophilus oryzae]|uniref:Uncharacterized protein LOC115884296 n=1 Tax=Sitophilus oryzae TaxID=7048 RepID=A0A6J2Y4V7_SITOR|nr:uncharacterized protein LOC115884296 [Sitophilus oryzae]
MPDITKKYKNLFKNVLTSKLFCCIYQHFQTDENDEFSEPENEGEELENKTIKNNEEFNAIQTSENIEVNNNRNHQVICMVSRSKSLSVLDSKRSTILNQEHPSNLSDLVLPLGHFIPVRDKVQKDQSIQYEPTGFNLKFNLSSFDLSMFKLDLLRKLRELKGDIIILKTLLKQADIYPERLVVRQSILPRQDDDFERKFYEAKNRAVNFVKFYKLGKRQPRKSRSVIVR